MGVNVPGGGECPTFLWTELDGRVQELTRVRWDLVDRMTANLTSLLVHVSVARRRVFTETFCNEKMRPPQSALKSAVTRLDSTARVRWQIMWVTASRRAVRVIASRDDISWRHPTVQRRVRSRPHRPSRGLSLIKEVTFLSGVKMSAAQVRYHYVITPL